jgi:hypothetical protein
VVSAAALTPPRRRRSLFGGFLLFAGAALVPVAYCFAGGLPSPVHLVRPHLSAPPGSALTLPPATSVPPTASAPGYVTFPLARPLAPTRNALGYGILPSAAPLPPTAGLGLSLPSPFGFPFDPTAAIAVDADDIAAGDSPGAAETIPAPSPTRATPGLLHLDCAVIPKTLQSGGEYWQALPYAAMPTRLAPPPRVDGGLADPIRGPSGNRSNLQAPGPAGAWCRPPPIPIADTSPLANRGFWIPASLVLVGVGVFWLSRGIELPP